MTWTVFVVGLFAIWIVYAWQSKLDTIVEELKHIRILVEQRNKDIE